MRAPSPEEETAYFKRWCEQTLWTTWRPPAKVGVALPEARETHVKTRKGLGVVQKQGTCLEFSGPRVDPQHQKMGSGKHSRVSQRSCWTCECSICTTGSWERVTVPTGWPERSMSWSNLLRHKFKWTSRRLRSPCRAHMQRGEHTQHLAFVSPYSSRCSSVDICTVQSHTESFFFLADSVNDAVDKVTIQCNEISLFEIAIFI